MSIESSLVRVTAPLWRDLLQLPKIVIYLVGFVPAVWWFWLGATDRLGADPMRVLEHALGLSALRFLIASLAIMLRRGPPPNSEMQPMNKSQN